MTTEQSVPLKINGSTKPSLLSHPLTGAPNSVSVNSLVQNPAATTQNPRRTNGIESPIRNFAEGRVVGVSSPLNANNRGEQRVPVFTQKDKPDHARDFAKQLDSLQTDWQNIKKVAGPRLDVIDEAQRERDTSDKKEDHPPKHSDTRDFAQQPRKPAQVSANSGPAGKPLTETGTGGTRDGRVFDINKAFEELDDIKSKIGSARASKPRVVAPTNGQKQAGQKLLNSPSDTMKSHFMGKEPVKTAAYKLTESMRLPSNTDERLDDAGERQVQLGWSAVQKPDASDSPVHQPEWDSHQLISPGKQELLASSLLAENKPEPPKRNLENIMATKKPAQPAIATNSELSSHPSPAFAKKPAQKSVNPARVKKLADEIEQCWNVTFRKMIEFEKESGNSLGLVNLSEQYNKILEEIKAINKNLQ